MFPDRNEESIVYFQNLHMFAEKKPWFSFGFKPLKKDLKTFIEDLNSFEYLNNMNDVRSTVVLDGRKVRLGFESESFDPLRKDKESQMADANRELIMGLMYEDDDANVQQAEFEFNISLGSRLCDILDSLDPMIVHIFKYLNLEASLKFHLRQFEQVLEEVTDQEWTEFVKPSDKDKGAKKGFNQPNVSKKRKNKKKKKKQAKEEHEESHEEEEEDEDEDNDEDQDNNDDDDEDDSQEDEDDEDDQDEDEQQGEEEEP